ncbi:hypothetical protein [Streptomonospora wellingtoniae]|nr:hypothetical protein [Streptomonospora sp. DSM 45055]
MADSRDALAEIRQSVLGGARSSLLLYFRNHPGESIPPHRLEGVAAIRAWPRRIRELRQVGWEISMEGSGPEACYRLTSDQLERDVAVSEETLESVKGASPAERLIEYLLHISPWPASPDQLERVAKVPTWRQEIFELIDQGWLIESHADNPKDVPESSFRLASLEDD